MLKNLSLVLKSWHLVLLALGRLQHGPHLIDFLFQFDEAILQHVRVELHAIVDRRIASAVPTLDLFPI